MGTGLFDCCYSSPAIAFASIFCPLACCIVQGMTVRKSMGRKEICNCLGPCILVCTTCCIGYAMNRSKIYATDFNGEYLIIGICCMPCGVTQEYHDTFRVNANDPSERELAKIRK